MPAVSLAPSSIPDPDLVAELLADQAPASRRWWDGVLPALLAGARTCYGAAQLGTGEDVLTHALGMARMTKELGLDLEARVAAVLFAVADFRDLNADLLIRWCEADGLTQAAEGAPALEAVVGIVQALARLKTLRPLIQAEGADGQRPASASSQAEVLRKMMLAMASDVRVVVLRLASRLLTLRYFAAQGDAAAPMRVVMARETLAVYAPLANRLGIWQLKWELEDLAFRFLEPETYKRIARLLDERRVEREAFIERAIATLKAELAKLPELAGSDVYGRPKHIYSIWNKMRAKGLSFDQLYDVRALRVIVPEVRDCYTALGIVHQLWQPIRGEFDDYISNPKGNDYRSLHTAVLVDDGRALEVQIRTEAMHRHAELGIAAHWRYKEAGQSAKAAGDYEEKIAWLRQMLSWREDITEAVSRSDEAASSVDWVSEFRKAALDDTLYVMTPQGRVIDLPKDATPLDFAYRIHTDLGHRCRGARVNGQLVPLTTPLQSGQRVEVITAKQGGPSRDWLTPGYLVSGRARQKVKQWFAALDTSESLAQGRQTVMRELQRLGEANASLEQLAARLGLPSLEALFLAAARGEVTGRAIGTAVRGSASPSPESAVPAATATSRASGRGGDVLVVGVDNLMTQMGRCCKPIPPDAIIGYVTRGRGVSVHRVGCRSLAQMARRNPERVISAEWGARGESAPGLYAVDLVVEAGDRPEVLRDVSEVLARERVAVTELGSQRRHGRVHMRLTVEVSSSGAVQRVMSLLREVAGVESVRRP